MPLASRPSRSSSASASSTSGGRGVSGCRRPTRSPVSAATISTTTGWVPAVREPRRVHGSGASRSSLTRALARPSRTSVRPGRSWPRRRARPSVRLRAAIRSAVETWWPRLRRRVAIRLTSVLGGGLRVRPPRAAGSTRARASRTGSRRRRRGAGTSTAPGSRRPRCPPAAAGSSGPAPASPDSAQPRAGPGRWKPPETTTHRPVAGVGERRADPLGHVRLAGGVVVVRGRLAAHEVEVRVEPLGESFGVGDLEQVVPQRVDVVDGEGAAQPVDRVGVAALGVGVAVARPRRTPGARRAGR